MTLHPHRHQLLPLGRQSLENCRYTKCVICPRFSLFHYYLWVYLFSVRAPPEHYSTLGNPSYSRSSPFVSFRCRILLASSCTTNKAPKATPTKWTLSSLVSSTAASSVFDCSETSSVCNDSLLFHNLLIWIRFALHHSFFFPPPSIDTFVFLVVFCLSCRICCLPSHFFSLLLLHCRLSIHLYHHQVSFWRSLVIITIIAFCWLGTISYLSLSRSPKHLHQNNEKKKKKTKSNKSNVFTFYPVA